MGNPFYGLDHGASPPTCGGGKKSSPEREALGRSRGGFSTKIHIRCESTGRLITFLLTPGQESDIQQAEALMESGAIRRRSGQVRLRPQRLVADKGYTSRARGTLRWVEPVETNLNKSHHLKLTRFQL